MENKSRNVCVGSRMGLRGIFFKFMFIKKKGAKTWRQLGRHGISLVKKKRKEKKI